jgi:hypothetical protein
MFTIMPSAVLFTAWRRTADRYVFKTDADARMAVSVRQYENHLNGGSGRPTHLSPRARKERTARPEERTMKLNDITRGTGRRTRYPNANLIF